MTADRQRHCNYMLAMRRIMGTISHLNPSNVQTVDATHGDVWLDDQHIRRGDIAHFMFFQGQWVRVRGIDD